MTFNVQAQRDKKHQDRIESMRIAFITKKLDLSPDEAQNFWPIYNKYRKEHKALRNNYNTTKNPGALSDAEGEGAISAALDLEEKEVALKRKYYAELKGILPVQKTAMLRRAERQFKEQLVKQLNDRRQKRRNGSGMK